MIWFFSYGKFGPLKWPNSSASGQWITIIQPVLGGRESRVRETEIPDHRHAMTPPGKNYTPLHRGAFCNCTRHEPASQWNPIQLAHGENLWIAGTQQGHTDWLPFAASISQSHVGRCSDEDGTLTSRRRIMVYCGNVPFLRSYPGRFEWRVA